MAGSTAWFNSAGYALAGPIEATSLDEARAQFEVNLLGVLRVCQAVLPSMRRRRSGRIVNISSIGGLVGLPFQGLYAASKFALEGLSESLRLETRDFGVRVVLVEPGDVRTAITSHRVFTAAFASQSPYHERARRAFAVVEKEERHGIDADAVAALVLRIAASAPPRLRYTVGHLNQRLVPLLKRVLPWAVCERLLLSFYGVSPALGQPPATGPF